MSLNLHDKFEKTFIVLEEIYEGFVLIFKDTNPLHTDEHFAINHGFKGRVMHGNILNGFISYFIGECLPTKHVIIHTQEIQFKNPVYLNDKLFFEAIISDVFESVNAIEFKFSFKNAELKTVAKGKIQIGILK
jgi:3-hydroxybutyryl-CoA dehydratase